jgi:hypothetical protein
MNSFTKLVASISALIASLSLAWIALTITGTIPHHTVILHHTGDVELGGEVELSGGNGSFDISHSGDIEIIR